MGTWWVMRALVTTCRRKITLSYRGLPMSMQISSITEEVEVRINAVLRGLATARAQIPSLACEDELVAGSQFNDPKKNVIEADIMESAVKGRELANTLLNSEASGDGEAVKAR